MVGGTPRSDPGHSALVLSHQRPNHRRGCTLHWIGNAKTGQATSNIIKPAPAAPRRGLFAPVVKAVWVVVVLVWPLLKWIVSIDVFFQFIRMVYHWNTPGVLAGWTFLAHFAVLVALTYFVSIYKPKGI